MHTIQQIHTQESVAANNGVVTRVKACTRCKDKKLKCDRNQTLGACTNCSKNGAPCSSPVQSQ